MKGGLVSLNFILLTHGRDTLIPGTHREARSFMVGRYFTHLARTPSIKKSKIYDFKNFPILGMSLAIVQLKMTTTAVYGRAESRIFKKSFSIEGRLLLKVVFH